MSNTVIAESLKPGRIAIVTATRYGQTSKIAEFLRSQLMKSGLSVTGIALKEAAAPIIDWSQYDSVIVGCPVYAGKFVPEMVSWVRANASQLANVPSAFFSVSLNAADARPTARIDDDRLLKQFLDQTGMKPEFVASIAGALPYTKYGFFKRFLMKKISASVGGPTDTSRDYEMTDWKQVAAFAEAFSGQVTKSPFATINRLPGLREAA